MVTRLVLVSGMSGAGKSTAMSILEDLGYHCIDQFPTELMPELVRLLRETSEKQYTNVALSTTLTELPEICDALIHAEMDFQLLILSAGDKELLTRYKFTRHTHPLLADGIAASLDTAIRLEREMLDRLPQYNKAVYLDTGDLSYNDLKKQLDDRYSLTVRHDLTITFESFGYKHGIPQDADFLFDVRVLPNPYWVPELRKYTGDDQPVYDYVMGSEAAIEYCKKLTALLDFIFQSYEKDGRAHIIIGIGCTGGQHRSVSMVNYLMKQYEGRYHCYKEYRSKKQGDSRL